MSDRWAEFGQVGKSRACSGGAHGDCAHFVTVGGGFNRGASAWSSAPGCAPARATRPAPSPPPWGSG